MTQKAVDAAVCIIRIDPFKSTRVTVCIIHSRRIFIKMQQFRHKVKHLPVPGLLKKKPVQFPVFRPLAFLREILPHKQQLLARMSEHVCVAALQIGKFVIIKARHLVDHRTLQMDNLIM